MIISNPADDARPPADRRGDVYIPTLGAVDVLRDALPPEYRTVVDLVIGSGLRQGEVFGLEVGGIDFLRTRAVDVRQ